MHPAVTAIVAKVGAFKDLRPRTVGTIGVAAGILLIWSAFRDGRRWPTRMSDRAPGTYAEFLRRTSGTLLWEPSAAQRGHVHECGHLDHSHLNECPVDEGPH